MWIRKIVEWLVRKILWPLLKMLAQIIIEEVIRKLAERIREWLRARENEETARAKSDHELASIASKYDKMKTELNDLEANIISDIPHLIDESFMKAETDREKIMKKLDTKTIPELPSPKKS